MKLFKLLLLVLITTTSHATTISELFYYKQVKSLSCENFSITSFSPEYAPVGTIVQISGSGFQSGVVSSVKFNGIEAESFDILSDTQISVVVPESATTGFISVIIDGCEDAFTNDFVVLVSECTNITYSSDIFISELYDSENSNYGIIELYNNTGNSVNLSGYFLERYGNIGDLDPTSGYNSVLSGILEHGETYLIQYGSSGTTCSVIAQMNGGSGFNANDEFKLRKNTTVIDNVHAPNYVGYNVRRKSEATEPSSVYNSSDWVTSSAPEGCTDCCSDIGVHTVDGAESPININHPSNVSVCGSGEAILNVDIDGETEGYLYQWKMIDTDGNWINVPNQVPYSGTNTPQLTVNPVVIGVTSQQYYCEIISLELFCEIYTNTAVILSDTSLEIPSANITQPTCIVATGSLSVTAPLGSQYEYSINGIDYQNSPLFSNIEVGTHQLTIKEGNCTSLPLEVVIIASPSIPDTPSASITQPTCGLITGSINVTAPVGSQYEYSINGIDYQNNPLFENIGIGTHQLTVKEGDCVSLPIEVVIVASPNIPDSPSVNITQPTCTVTTGSLHITAPLGSQYEYSINGVDYQNNPLFENIEVGTHQLIVKEGDCVSLPLEVVIVISSDTPNTPSATITQPTCTLATGSLNVTVPLGSQYEYSINGIDYQNSPLFENIELGTHYLTVKEGNCVSLPLEVAIVNSFSLPEFSISGNNLICENDSTTLTISNPNFDINDIDVVYEWRLNGVLLGETTYSLEANQIGTYQLLVDINGCTHYNEFAVTLSQISATIIPECNNSDYELTVETENSQSIQDYLWNTGETTSSIIVTQTGRYSVILYFGDCEKEIFIDVDSVTCFIQKGISPNGDGLNDWFDLTGVGVRELKIYNRYGREVYSRSNYVKEWGGQDNNGNDLPDGTYFYAIQKSNGEKLTDWIYINRNN